MARSIRPIVGPSLAFAAGFAAAGVVAAYRRDLRAARERVAEGSRIAETIRGPIEYAEAGEGEAVLVVHGAGGGIDQGLDLGAPLAARGFRVIAMSRFGYLRTPLPADASAQAQADAHALLLDRLGLDRVAVVGASAGAPSALQFALRHPQRCRALVLMVPAAYAPRPGRDTSKLPVPPMTRFVLDIALHSDLLFWAATRHAKRIVVRNLLATPPDVVDAATPDEQQRVVRLLEHILPVSARRLGLVNDARITSSLERAPLERVAAKTLTISVDDDLFGTCEAARYTAEHVPGARFVHYETGGHVLVGHERDVADEIARFLSAAR